jgi:hypothetical protein
MLMHHMQLNAKLMCKLFKHAYMWPTLWAYVIAQNKKVQQKRHSSKYLSAFLQAIRHQSRHPG